MSSDAGVPCVGRPRSALSVPCSASVLLLVVAAVLVGACQAALQSLGLTFARHRDVNARGERAASIAAVPPTDHRPPPPPTHRCATDGRDGTLTPAAPDPGVSEAAAWWLDPASLPIDPQATRLRGFVVERGCASGRSPEGRILKPDVDYGAEALTVTFSIAPRPGVQDCLGNEPFGVIFELVEPVGGRPILDGSTTPARDAATIPEN